MFYKCQKDVRMNFGKKLTFEKKNDPMPFLLNQIPV